LSAVALAKADPRFISLLPLRRSRPYPVDPVNPV
jgi:hypothetical protein